MGSPSQDEGVYFRPEDYVGLSWRLLIDVVDLIVVCGIWALLTLPLLMVLPKDKVLWGHTLLLTLAGVSFSYLVVLKRSRFRTLGYVLAGARIVNLRGDPPSIASMTLRLFFTVLGPFNLLLDLLWIGSDSYRQALHDKFAHTYVVKKTAVPSGRGPIGYASYDIFGWHFIFQEVYATGPGHAP